MVIIIIAVCVYKIISSVCWRFVCMCVCVTVCMCVTIYRCVLYHDCAIWNCFNLLLAIAIGITAVAAIYLEGIYIYYVESPCVLCNSHS